MSPIRLASQAVWFCPDCQGDDPNGDYLERLADPSGGLPTPPRSELQAT